MNKGSEYLLEIRGGTKTYAGVNAIEDVNFMLRAGEVHALLGENGAGKSTLCKVIAGTVVLDQGELLLDGQPQRFDRPGQALKRGITMVYQETSLVPSMTVAQNLRLGDEPLVARMRSVNIESRQIMRSLNFPVQVMTLVSSLGSAQKQMVEIARAIRREAKVVIFDEPTATLTPEEIENLYGAIEQLKKAGVGIIFVSHALEESLRIADRITVLRDGQHQRTAPTSELTRDDIVKLMVGRDVEYTRVPPAYPKGTGDRVLSVENLTMGTLVRNMSFSAFGGQITGIAGLVGSGRTEAALVVAGAVKRQRLNGGRVLLNGKPVRFSVPREAVRNGVAYVTEDRKVNGFFETMSIADNIYLGHMAGAKRLRLLGSRSKANSLAERWIERFKIRTLGPRAKVRELSGGNQQKVVVAKSLTHHPQLIIFDEPTRGVDVGSIAEIHRLVREYADAGAAVVLISSYLPEILALSDRILVARAGRVVAEFDPQKATAEDVMFAAVR